MTLQLDTLQYLFRVDLNDFCILMITEETNKKLKIEDDLLRIQIKRNKSVPQFGLSGNGKVLCFCCFCHCSGKLFCRTINMDVNLCHIEKRTKITTKKCPFFNFDVEKKCGCTENPDSCEELPSEKKS